MKKIVLKKLSLINFKGIKELVIDTFEDGRTDIFGANGTGKTTIFDAFTWLLFGKDSTDRKDFEIKTLDALGKVIPKIEHEVNAIIEVDNVEISIRRILKENWVKRRGSIEAEFSGNVTEYFWNDVPMKQGDFQKKVNEILDESVFKMITSPMFFNSMEWKQRRSILTELAGDVSNEEIAIGNSAYQELLSNLTQEKSLQDYKAQVLASVKKAKEELKVIPSRIDEVMRGVPDKEDFEVLEKQLKSLQGDFEKVEGKITNSNKAFQSKLDEQRELKIKINNLQSEIEIIESNTRKQAEESQRVDTSTLDKLSEEHRQKLVVLDNLNTKISNYGNEKQSIENQIKSIEDQLIKKREEWKEINSRKLEFNDEDFCCPTCKREFDASDVEVKKAEFTSNFNKSQKQGLDANSQQGKALSEKKKGLEKELDVVKTLIQDKQTEKTKLNNELSDLSVKINDENVKISDVTDKPTVESVYTKSLENNTEYNSKKSELSNLKSSLKEDPQVDNSELIEERKEISSQIDDLKAKLQKKQQIENAHSRIKELEEQECKLAQQVADVEKIQFTIENFIKDKIDRIEAVVNQKFKFVTFKMFDEQINGGIKETCEALIDGVPFSDANTASKINAGLDVINTLSEFYEVSAPIFVDNAESVHTLTDTNSQLIRLVVSETHKKLTVSAKELVA